MIELNDNWRISADDRCYILEEFIVSKRTGVGKWSPQYYYATLPGTLIGFRKNAKRAAVVNGDNMTLGEYIKLSIKIDSDFIKNIKNICTQCEVFERNFR